MSLSVCPRCESQAYEAKLSTCMGCQFRATADSEGDVPIPSWVLKYINPTAAELAEIKEINFGIPPARIPIPNLSLNSESESQTPKERRATAQGPRPTVTGRTVQLRRKVSSPMNSQNLAADDFAYLETGQAVM